MLRTFVVKNTRRPLVPIVAMRAMVPAMPPTLMFEIGDAPRQV